MMLINVKKEVKVRNCPFCNANDRILTIRNVWDLNSGHHKIDCLGCGASGPDADNEAEAVMMWNSRKV